MNRALELNSEIKNLVKEAGRIKQLREQKESELRILQKNCNHNFAKTVYDPEDTFKEVFDHCETHGVDIWPVSRRVPDKKDRWYRTCQLCGLIQYAYEQKNMAQPKFEPYFPER